MKKSSRLKEAPSGEKNNFVVAVNRKARFDYSILETLEAGLVLTGSEVKSLRQKNCQLKDAYLVFKRSEPYLQKSHIGPYGPAGVFNHEPERRRKLLLHSYELKKLIGRLGQKGLSCVPLKIYFKKGKAKVELAIVKGKKRGDKRQALKKKEMDRLARRAMKHHR